MQGHKIRKISPELGLDQLQPVIDIYKALFYNQLTMTNPNFASNIRRRVLEHIIRNNGGYLSQACSSAEIMEMLFTRVLKLKPVASPVLPKPFPGVPSRANTGYFRGTDVYGERTPETDRFILSPTHYSLVLYAALIEAGRLHEDAMLQFNKDGGSVEMIGAEHSPGMEVMTGSLGQGLSQAIGIALARKMKNETGRVWVMMSDGEFEIGMTWEGLQFASHHKLDNLAIIADVNKFQCDGPVTSVMAIDPLDRRIDSFGCKVFRCYGHNTGHMAALAEKRYHNMPLVILAETSPWQGVEINKENAPKMHYLRFKSEDQKKKYAEFLEGMK